jgi:hypothetical protein
MICCCTVLVLYEIVVQVLSVVQARGLGTIRGAMKGRLLLVGVSGRVQAAGGCPVSSIYRKKS